MLRKYWKRLLSRIPPIPITLFLGRPDFLRVRYVIGSIGLETMIRIAFGEYLRTFSTTLLTIPALTPISSSLVIPGFLGRPEVTTTTSELAVAL